MCWNMITQLTKPNEQIALFGTGCFWEGESTFMNLKGIVKTEVGYATDGSKNRKLLVKRKNNIEVVKVTFNPEIISYEKLLAVFWNTHDPTDKQHLNKSNGERAVIFFISPDQQKTAKKSKKELENSSKFTKPVLTEITLVSDYHRAKDYHQKYFFKRGG